MKGILLAGGTGTRLGACTWAVSKQLLPIYDKPMIYYPLSILMLAGIREIELVCAPNQLESYQRLLGDGSGLGLFISYHVQEKPRGIADAFLVTQSAIEGQNTCLILGDNVFYGQGFVNRLSRIQADLNGAVIFGYPVTNPSDYGVVTIDVDGKPLALQEKPVEPHGNLAVPGLYFYDENALDYARSLEKSARGELEITDLNRIYLNRGQLSVEELGRGMAWLDTGTPQGLLQASQFVETVQSRQGLYIACIEEIAWRMGYISSQDLNKHAIRYAGTAYGEYIDGLSK